MTLRPLGPPVSDARPAADPAGLRLAGDHARLDPLDPAADAPGLWASFAGHDWLWDYLGETPPADPADLRALLDQGAARLTQPCYVIRRRDDPAPLGYACYWTVQREMGTIEIGNVNLSPALQGTIAATEAFSLMLRWAFEHGYRRVEWKCNALNAPSRRAAQRLGFSYEGLFRQHLIVKGRNRDTAWLAMTDTDWQAIGPAHARWLAPSNFDAMGRQVLSLSALTLPHLVQRDPAVRIEAAGRQG